MKTLTLEEAAAWLLANDGYTILTHRRPDGDALGSAAGLCYGLRKLGKKACVLENPQTTDRYRPYVAPYTAAQPEGHMIAVDIATPGLFPNNYSGPVELCIDHHGTNSFYADMTHVESETAACGEIIFRLLGLLSVPVDPVTAEALYAAVSTDTGCFRYSNTTSDTLRIAAALKDCGADTYRLNQELFEQKTPARFALEAYLYRSMRTWCGGKVALCTLKEEDRIRMGVTEDDADSIAGFSRNMTGVEIGGLLRDIPAGSAKLSLRTEDRLWDASRICARLGGGGHKAASGASLSGSTVEELLSQLLAAIEAETGLTMTEDA